MNFRPPEKYYMLWDSWVCEKDAQMHLFFLCRDWWRGDHIKRNYIGRAVSDDLLHWRILDRLKLWSDDADDWDGKHSYTFTGNTCDAGNGEFWLTYGSFLPTPRAGIARSPDLIHWTKQPNNPVFLPGPPYEDGAGELPAAFRDVSISRDPRGGYEAVFCSRLNSGAFDERGAVGRARSQYGYAWTFLPPLVRTGCVQEPEVPSRYSRDGRFYVVFCSSENLRTARGNSRYPLLRNACFYASSRAWGGEWTFSPEQVLAPGDAYVGRIVDFKGEPLFFHHTVGSKSAYGIPKAVDFDAGRIRLRKWSGMRAIERGALPRTVADSQTSAPGETAVSGNHLELDSADGCGVTTWGSYPADLSVRISLQCHARRAAFAVRWDRQRKMGVGFEYIGESGQFALCTMIERGYAGLLPEENRCLRYLAPEKKGAFQMELVVRSEGVDWFLDGVHIAMTTHDSCGYPESPTCFALMADHGTASATIEEVVQLSPERNYRSNREPIS